ncbi:MAG: polysaccharide deacetylase family protein [candidate division KSB1 bacterium]|nr:polysaccharide deacetylase family protein [candidate division KSB1 bacterium]MDZ7303314.1 polysaccharide deacetylase family protein [candidate division KSB1 bacterium]MDZ7310436.1 polysaccharide deacetylase family protein [candidate division KSB1 bacterium]
MTRRNFVLIMFCLTLMYSAPSFSQDQAKLLIRVDDIGMCHAVNMAMQQLAETGMPVSASVMFSCPWYLEAVEILKAHPEIAVGIHLTLNSEWKHYKWGPVLGKAAVPSLVDSNGYFFATHAEFNAQERKADEVEKELRAQIERALRSGVEIDYLDYHMGTAVSRPEFTAIVEKLAKENNLGLAHYFGEIFQAMFAMPIESKKDSLCAAIRNLQPGKTHVMVMHIGLETPEMEALIDLDSPIMRTSEGVSLVSKHRQAELNALCSQEYREVIGSSKVALITYRDLITQAGLKAMKRPE